MVRRDKTNYVIQSVSHSLDVLEQFAGEVDELGVTELSKRLKLHKNNVFRLLATLQARGYIEQNRATERYRLGIKCYELGNVCLGHTELAVKSRPVMERLAAECSETVCLVVGNRDILFYCEVIPSRHAVRVMPYRVYPAGT